MTIKNLAREMLVHLLREGHQATWKTCQCKERKLHEGIEAVITR